MGVSHWSLVIGSARKPHRWADDFVVEHESLFAEKCN